MVIATLNGLPGSWYSFMWGMCSEIKWLIPADYGKKMIGETEYQALTIQRRSFKRWGIWRTQFLKNLLSILSIWIRNEEVMNEEDDEVEGSRRSLPTKGIKDKYLIVISWYCFVILIIFSWCVMHDRLFALMTVYY